MTFYASSSNVSGPLRHLFCPRHIHLGPICGKTSVTTGLSESTPLCPDCEEVRETGCPLCGFPGDIHRTPAGGLIRRG